MTMEDDQRAGSGTAQIHDAAGSALVLQLGKMQLLQDLEYSVVESIALGCTLKKVERNEFLLHKGSSGEYLFFLVSGRLQVVDVMEDGREIGLNFLDAGSYFGELSVIDELPRSASVRATEASTVALLPRRLAQELIYGNPLIAERIMKRMAASLRMATEYRTLLAIPGAVQRVFALLLQLAKVSAGGVAVIDNLPKQKEIAIMVNTSRETVSRAIQELIQAGIVERDVRRLIIRRPERLTAIAASTPLRASDD